jgi:H+-transporting ATPase
MLASIKAWCVAMLGRILEGEAHDDPSDDGNKIDDFLNIQAVFLDPVVLKTYRQVSLFAFNPRTEATIKDSKGNECKISEGMPPVIFQLPDVTGEDLVKAQRVVDDYAAKGYRTLAAARTEESGKWVMLGILPMLDPTRPSSAIETVARASEYG